MIKTFLKQYEPAESLDQKRFAPFFPESIQRADYLLRGGSVIVEAKEIRSIQVRERAERLSRTPPVERRNLKRAMYSTLNNALRQGGHQVRDTRSALTLPDSLGLIIIENCVPADLSFLTLVDACERKMLGGLKGIDGVLCLDCVNVFFDPEGKPITGSQIVARQGPRGEGLCGVVHQLMDDLCRFEKVRFQPGHDLASGDQRWIVDSSGNYQKYDATFEFES